MAFRTCTLEAGAQIQSISGGVWVAHFKGVEGLRYTIVDAPSEETWLLESFVQGYNLYPKFGYPKLKIQSHEYVLTHRPNTTLKEDPTSSTASQDRRNAIYPSLPR